MTFYSADIHNYDGRCPASFHDAVLFANIGIDASCSLRETAKSDEIRYSLLQTLSYQTSPTNLLAKPPVWPKPRWQ